MVTSGAIYARIDRPAKTVSFSKPKDANDVLNEWSGNIHNLLGLCEKLGHLITKVYQCPDFLIVGGDDAFRCKATKGALAIEDRIYAFFTHCHCPRM